ncbi:MAG: protein translocase subunit SecF [Treponema sp.]|nr:protein translocase subunit SecF [Treponema sp.]
MRRIIRFSKLFTFTAVFSTLIVIIGIAGFFVMSGFNLGVDFQAGLIQEIQFAPTAFSLTWSGRGNASISFDRSGMYIVHSGVGIESRTIQFLFSEYTTIGELTGALSEQLEGLEFDLLVPAEISSQWLVRSSQRDPRLDADIPYLVHYLDPRSEEIPIATVREALDALGQTASVQSLGQPSDRHFMIRIQDTQDEQTEAEQEIPVQEEIAEYDETAEVIDWEETIAELTDAAEFDDTDEMISEMTEEIAEAADTIRDRPAERITGVLEAFDHPDFGAGNVVVLRSDYVGSRFSRNLTDQVGILIACTLLLILAYAAIRFKLQYAVGAVLGILLDSLVIVSFVVWTRMEFNTTTIAAILTILGYSINNTIVVFDRIRENRRLYPDDVFENILDRSLTETLNRTVITTVTTMLAVLSLFIFTTGSMKDFALALLVGMTSGVYTTTFIATGIINFWEKRRLKRVREKQSAQPVKA